MQRFRTAFGWILVVLAFATVAGAGVFEPKQLPRDVKWVIHLDMDAARDSKAWNLIWNRIDNNPDARKRLHEIKTVTGMNFPEGLHEITLFGRGFAQDEVVVLLRADLDRGQTRTTLQTNPKSKSAAYGKYDVMSWGDHGTIIFGSFYGHNQFIIGRSQQAVEDELDLLDGKGDSMKGDSFLPSGSRAGVLLYLAGEGLLELKAKNPESPIVPQATQAWISLEETQQDLVARAHIVAESAPKAEELLKAIDGIRALATLSSGGQNADVKTKAAVALLQTLSLKQEGKTVVANCPVSLEAIRSLLEAPATQPAETHAP